MLVAGLEQGLLLVRAQAPVTVLGWRRFADIADRIVEKPHAPFLDGDGEQVREQGEFQPYGAGGLVGLKPLVAVFGHQVRRDGGQAVGAELFLQRLGLVALRVGRALPLAGGHLTQIPIDCLLQQQLLRTGAVDVDPAYHFIFGAARPVIGVAFGAERLDGRRPAALANDRLPGVRGCFGDRCHIVFRTGVPKVYRVTQGLTEENFCLVDKYGGQGSNRTTDTGIFSARVTELMALKAEGA